MFGDVGRGLPVLRHAPGIASLVADGAVQVTGLRYRDSEKGTGSWSSVGIADAWAGKFSRASSQCAAPVTPASTNWRAACPPETWPGATEGYDDSGASQPRSGEDASMSLEALRLVDQDRQPFRCEDETFLFA